jgi:hypothetical protein
VAVFRFLVVDEDGRRVGRFETNNASWEVGDLFVLDEQPWRISEILPEVSTMVAYNAMWVAVPAAVDEDAPPSASPATDTAQRGEAVLIHQPPPPLVARRRA